MDESQASSEAITTLTPVDTGGAQTWAVQQLDMMKETPWWYDTPTLYQPLQEKAWYLPETKAAPLEYLNTSPKVTLGPAGLVLVVGCGLGLLWHYLG